MTENKLVLRRCPGCGMIKQASEYYIIKSGKNAGYLRHYCKICNNRKRREWQNTNKERRNKMARERRHQLVLQNPLNNNPCCAAWLAVIAENILAKAFGATKKMPYGNPGFDFICDKSFKIDVKAACLTKDNKWIFRIYKNKIADYFICLGFRDRVSLEPRRVWIIPQRAVVGKESIGMHANSRLSKWDVYERPITKISDLCRDINLEQVLRSEFP